jgi:hypothetical protein
MKILEENDSQIVTFGRYFLVVMVTLVRLNQLGF